MINIVVATRPSRIYVAEHMLQSISEFQDARNILLIEFPNECSYNKNIWNEVLRLRHIGGSIIGRGNHLKAEENIKLINSLLNNKEEINMFISDIQFPIHNRIFFDTEIRSRVNFIIIPDGISLYLGLSVTNRFFIRNVIKSMLGVIGYGARYTPYWGNYEGIDHANIKTIYCFHPELVPYNSIKKQAIPPIRQSIEETLSNECLFIAQPLWAISSTQILQEIRNKTIEFLVSLQCEKYFFKNHPEGRTEDDKIYADHGFTIINNHECIEKIFEYRKFATVVSYNSSALFNLKTTYGNNIRCISIMNRRISSFDVNNYSNRLTEIFSRVGIEVIEDV